MKKSRKTYTIITGASSGIGYEFAKMFKFMKPANATSVAEYGYKKMMQRKVTVYHGMFTNIANMLSRIVSRRTSTRFAGIINGK